MNKRASFLIASLLLLAAESAAFAQTPILSFDQAAGFPGDVVTLRLVLTTGGIPVVAAESAFTYDTDQLTFVSASVTGSALTAGKKAVATVESGVLERLTVYDDGTNWSTPIEDGDLPLMRFRIAPTATPGSLLTILTHDCSVTVAPATKRAATCGTGLVFVQVAGTSPVISLGEASGAAGTSVTLALGLATNGMLPIATETTIAYDASKLSYVSSAAGNAASAAGKSVDPSVAGGVLQKIAVYATGGSWNTPIGNGDLALITFQIGAAVTPGSQLTVSISGCKYTIAPATTTDAACGNNGSISVSGAATCPDADGDNYAVCTATCNPAPGKQCGDCNDGNGAVHPNTLEVCNGIDDNCDTVIDNGQAALCDDGNVCTTDACGGAAGCTHVNNSLSCNDGNACTQADTCQGGACAGSNPVVCTALDQCHNVGVCNTGTGVCSNPAKPNGTACNDGNACTLNEACSGGICGGGTARSCDDAQACTADVCDPAIGCLTSVTNLDTGGFSAARVDGRDLVVLADAYNSCPGDLRYRLAANLDRVQTLPGACIDGTDFHLFMVSFGHNCP